MVSTNDGADALILVFEGFDVPMGVVVQTPLVGLRVRQTSNHCIVD
jgi:hypothetical protein